MQLEVVGSAHCNHPYCHQLDFLPFKCDLCKKVFCQNHFAHANHQCENAGHNSVQVILCPVCHKTIRIQAGEDPNATWDRHWTSDCSRLPAPKEQPSTCPVIGCKQKLSLSNRFTCSRCRQTVCLHHRMEEHHACVPSPASCGRPSISSAIASLKASRSVAASRPSPAVKGNSRGSASANSKRSLPATTASSGSVSARRGAQRQSPPIRTAVKPKAKPAAKAASGRPVAPKLSSPRPPPGVRNAALPQPKPSAPNIAERLRTSEHGVSKVDQKIAASSSGSKASLAAQSSPLAPKKVEESEDKTLKRLLEITNVSRDAAVRALRANNGDLERAVNALLSVQPQSFSFAGLKRSTGCIIDLD
eukprot:TRINITY_DN26308_c0_g1_i1.p1 TRINITY_DN26308_c0_g1~~TRINITY_DN26308_c0_g1_i1.p1  ORF type:complete len:361 (+),score=61.79 TRINITY_DN26308_c0_g1_i1:76-1158(+)